MHSADLGGILFADTTKKRLDSHVGMHLGHILTVIDRRPLREGDTQAEGPDSCFHGLKELNPKSTMIGPNPHQPHFKEETGPGRAATDHGHLQ